MSDYKFRCPRCLQSLAAPPELMGHAIDCPSCGDRIQLPQGNGSLPGADLAEAKDGSVLVRIPAGDFEMGDGLDDDCPKHRVDVSEYWIAVACVTNRQYARFVKETKHRAPDQADTGNPVWRKKKCPDALLDHPVVCVSWHDAVAYAQWVGLRLPSEAQWEKAARGPQGWVFPWGDAWNPKHCRNGSNKGAGTTAAVRDYPEGAGGYGTHQQAGNVWEWCADWYDGSYYENSPVKDPVGAPNGTIRVGRGGSWCEDDATGFRAAFRNGNVPAARAPYLGFRLVAIHE